MLSEEQAGYLPVGATWTLRIACAACRYFSQAVGGEDPGGRDMQFDIATEEMRHLEIIGSIVAMLNKGARGQLAEGVEQEAELYRSLTVGGNDSHPTALLKR